MCETDWRKTILRERVGERSVEREIGNTVLRERLGEHCVEIEIGGTLYSERDWGNTC